MDLKKISHYRIVRMIGSGGMGDVYLAEDTRLKRRVALKILPIEAGSDGAKAVRFEKEARAASSLSHPNILTVYDVGQADAFRYIVTEFVDGQTLRQYFSHGRIPLKKAVKIVSDVAKALSAAHDVGIIHRDVKPENIMIRPDGLVKVLDFGLAKLAKTSDMNVSLAETTPGLILGTPKYMSPEQVRGFEVDQRTDIFSLGVVFYEMVTGVAPFEGATVGDTIAAILRSDPAPISDYIADADPALQSTLDRCLAKDAEIRFRTMRSLNASLAAVSADGGNARANPTRLIRSEATDQPTLIAGKTVAFDDTAKNSPERTAPVLNKPEPRRFVVAAAIGLMTVLALGFFVFRSLTWTETKDPFRVDGDQGMPESTIDPTNYGIRLETNTAAANILNDRKYTELSDSERRQYLLERTMELSRVIGNRNSDPVPSEALDRIKTFTDRYASRIGSAKTSGCWSRSPWNDDLQTTYDRARINAPLIIRAFNEKGVDPRFGIYLAMIESEHCLCLQSPTGPLGLFQFTTERGELLGLRVRYGATAAKPDERCEPEPSARAAASYMKLLMVRYGEGPASVPLAIGIYNTGINETLYQALSSNSGMPQDFWTVFSENENVSRLFQSENFKYVPKFFAAAIIGESPEDFGLELRPLSSYMN